MEPMGRYERKSAASKIDGYLPIREWKQAVSPELEKVESVELARAECLIHLRRQIECVESLTVEQFYAEKESTQNLAFYRETRAVESE